MPKYDRLYWQGRQKGSKAHLRYIFTLNIANYGAGAISCEVNEDTLEYWELDPKYDTRLSNNRLPLVYTLDADGFAVYTKVSAAEAKAWRSEKADRDETGAWTGRGGGVDDRESTPIKRKSSVKVEEGETVARPAKRVDTGSADKGEGRADQLAAGPSTSSSSNPNPQPAPPPPLPTYTVVPQMPVNRYFDDPTGDIVLSSSDGTWARVRQVKLRGGSDYFDQLLKINEGKSLEKTSEGLLILRTTSSEAAIGPWLQSLLAPATLQLSVMSAYTILATSRNFKSPQVDALILALLHSKIDTQAPGVFALAVIFTDLNLARSALARFHAHVNYHPRPDPHEHEKGTSVYGIPHFLWLRLPPSVTFNLVRIANAVMHVSSREAPDLWRAKAKTFTFV